MRCCQIKNFHVDEEGETLHILLIHDEFEAQGPIYEIYGQLSMRTPLNLEGGVKGSTC